MERRDVKSARGIGMALVLSVFAWAAVIALVFCASRAFALDYQAWAERPGALLSATEPNVRLVAGPFQSRIDCLNAINVTGSQRIDPGKGWRLRCRPTEIAPIPKLKAEK